MLPVEQQVFVAYKSFLSENVKFNNVTVSGGKQTRYQQMMTTMHVFLKILFVKEKKGSSQLKTYFIFNSNF